MTKTGHYLNHSTYVAYNMALWYNFAIMLPESPLYHYSSNHIPEVSVQIVNYKTSAYLRECLRTLLDDIGTSPNCSIHVADNDSGDDLGGLEREFGSRVSFKTLNENVGYGQANNILSQITNSTRSPNMLILNPDLVFFQPCTVERLLNTLYGNERTKVVGPQLIDERGKRQKWDHADYPLTIQIGENTHNLWFLPVAPWKQDENMTSVPWVSGAVFLVDRESFVTAGGFDPKLFLYFEEVDLCQRLVKQGGQVIYNPEITVTHIGSVSTRDAKQTYFIDSFNYLVDKHHRPAIAKLMKTAYKFLPESAF